MGGYKNSLFKIPPILYPLTLSLSLPFRVHRHLLVMFARGVEPIFSNSDDDEEILSGNESFGDTIDREGSEQLIPAQST